MVFLSAHKIPISRVSVLPLLCEGKEKNLSQGFKEKELTARHKKRTLKLCLPAHRGRINLYASPPQHYIQRPHYPQLQPPTYIFIRDVVYLIVKDIRKRRDTALNEIFLFAALVYYLLHSRVASLRHRRAFGRWKCSEHCYCCIASWFTFFFSVLPSYRYICLWCGDCLGDCSLHKDRCFCGLKSI